MLGLNLEFKKKITVGLLVYSGKLSPSVKVNPRLAAFLVGGWGDEWPTQGSDIQYRLAVRTWVSELA